MTSFDLEKHLKEEHQISPFSTYLREIVYGGNDGIVTTFAVVAGFAGAQTEITQLPVVAVLLFGFANLFADGVSMSLGNFLSNKSEQDVYSLEKKKELTEIENNRHMEREESKAILIQKGFSESQAKQLVQIYATNEKYWLDFMMNQELSMSNPEGKNVYAMALATFLAFVTFGLIPLLPYIFFPASLQIFFGSIAATIIALTALGMLRKTITKKTWMHSVGETLLVGGCAASIAYLVGTFFRI